MCRMCHDPRFQTPAEKRSDVDFTEQRVDGETWFCDEPVGVTAKRAPGKKDKARWCKGKVGREHQLEVALPENAQAGRVCRWYSYSFSKVGRRWVRQQAWAYSCQHVGRCSACHKVLNPDPICPDQKPPPE